MRLVWCRGTGSAMTDVRYLYLPSFSSFAAVHPNAERFISVCLIAHAHLLRVRSR